MSFSQASRTAAVEPGMEKSAQPRHTPATARDIMAALPISSYESIRKSSPKPSRRFSRSPLTAS